jgi:hypothetical protein
MEDKSVTPSTGGHQGSFNGALVSITLITNSCVKTKFQNKCHYKLVVRKQQDG